MLRITKAADGEVVFKLSGRMDAENVSELESLLNAESVENTIVLDLKELRLVDQDVVSFLRRYEVGGIQLKNCPAYIREWIDGDRQ
jgi:anti-anti-sigma regulatory factor